MSPSRGMFPAIVSAIVAALPVVAPATADAPPVKVVYNDLNLSTAAGIDQLYSRIRQAAARYCDSQRVTGTRIHTAYDHCIKDTIALTVQRVNVKALSTVHADHGGGTSEG